jgi:co-chaperonin GroES (HSP10)
MIVPLEDNVVLRVTPEPEQKTDSGIILSSGSRATFTQAEVIAAGPGKALHASYVRDTPMFKQGHHVIIRNGAGVPLVHDGENLLICKFEDVIGIVTDVSKVREDVPDPGTAIQ